MHTIALRLHPGRLPNPDADLRYVLPDLMVERADGALTDDGWGYEGEPPFMVIFLQASDLEAGLSCVLDVVENVRVRENDLRSGCVVAVRQEDGTDASQTYDGYEVVYPPGCMEPFAPWASSSTTGSDSCGGCGSHRLNL